jgi:hypothetical protein
MSFRPSRPVNRPVTIALCLMLIATAMAVAFAATAHAAEYKMVNCAAVSGAPPYTLESNTGIFTFENDCVDQGGDPPGEKSFLRISEHEPGGMAAYGAYENVTFETPSGVNFRSAGGYLREPNAFNSGWQARFGFNYMNGSPQLQLVQGAGLQGAGQGYFGTTSTFAPFLWPWSYPIDFYRWTFQMICANPSGCDRTNYNAVDLNGIVFTLRDWEDSKVEWTNTGSELMAGRWVKGPQDVTWQTSDQGSGLRMERLRVDGAERWHIDHGPECDTSSDQTNGTYARVFQPCPTGGPWGRSYNLDTASLPDGEHHLKACSQDFAQWQGLNGTGGESCTERTIRTDNTPPGEPAGLAIRSSNPNRYLDHFGATFALPPNSGSPIKALHYDVVDESGDPVMPAKTVSATNPTEAKDVEGPTQPGAYRLKVWLEDEVGFQGPAAEAPIPHDTTPPAAPQGLQVASPETSRSAEGFDLRWRDIADNGSPIDAARYQVLDGSGHVVVPTQTVKGEGIEAIEDLETPSQAGAYTLKLWLQDEEGNQGAPVTAPLAYECVRSAAPGGARLDAGFGGQLSQTVPQGQGATLSGSLLDASGGPVAGAPLCVFARVTTDPGREFLGVAFTDAAGNYRFALAAGPSREAVVLYRDGQRRLHDSATLQTVVHPTLRARSAVVHNGEFAHLEGEVPGPHADGVVVVVQVRQGSGWLAFRRYTTRGDGHFEADYQFHRTTKPTDYEMRAQVRETTGYPYLQGESDPIVLHVVPGHAHHRRCPRGSHLAKRHGKARCVPRRCRAARHRRAGRHGGRARCVQGRKHRQRAAWQARPAGR